VVDSYERGNELSYSIRGEIFCNVNDLLLLLKESPACSYYKKECARNFLRYSSSRKRFIGDLYRSIFNYFEGNLLW
jgi:hypothetical protein